MGGIKTGISRAYLNRSALYNDVAADPSSFQFHSYSTGPIQAPYAYKPRRGVSHSVRWPPEGLALRIRFKPPSKLKDLWVTVVYELYEGLPLFSKWIEIESNALESNCQVTIEAVEILAVNEQWTRWIHIQADLPYGVVLNQVTEPHKEAGSFQTQFIYNMTDKVVYDLSSNNREYHPYLL